MSSLSTQASALTLPVSAPRRLSALVVDDEEPMRKLVVSMLEELGFRVTACSDGEEAWGLLEQRTPDLLVTDWLLPGMTGTDLVHQIRLSERFPGLYIIMVTARAEHDHRVEGLEAGADDFLPKPFNQEEFKVRVRAGQRVLHLRQQLVDQNRLLESSNRALSRELLAAGKLQRAILPSGTTRVPGYESGWALHPHGHASGDMFGVFSLDERHAGVFLVDVSGHGMAAAMLSFAVSRLLCPVPGQENLVKRRLTRPPFYEVVRPAEVLRGVREWFDVDEYDGFYFTLVYGILNAETGVIEWVSAGHVPPVFVRGGESVRFAGQRTQTPIGLPPRGDEEPNRAVLDPGERVFFYSDGLVDLRGADGLWLPDDALEVALARTSEEPIQRCVELAIQRLKERSGSDSLEDDATLVGMERRRAS